MPNLTVLNYSKSVFLLTFLLTLFVLLFATQGMAGAETEVALTHFTGCAFNTGGDATVLVPLDVAINGNLTLEAGDEIAIFRPDGSLCVGGRVWTGSGNIAMAAWGDNAITDPIDGLLGEKMQIRIWDDSANQEYIAQMVTYSSGDGYYVEDSLHVISSLTLMTDIIFVSFTNNGVIQGVSFADEDILAVNLATGLITQHIDFSDVQMTQDVDALLVEDNGDILFSTEAPITLPDIGAVDDSDIVRFTPTRVGYVTRGTFSRYFDGSDVGLTYNAEDVDALGLEPGNNRLLMSTLGAGSVGFGFRAEDLISFEPTSLGTTTAGKWRFYFDTSLTDIGSENIDALWVDGTNGDIYLSVRYDGTIGGQTVASDDIVRCVPGSTGYTASCTTINLFWNAAASGFGNLNIDGLSIVNDVPGDILYVSTQEDGNVDGVPFRDEDVLVYDPRLDKWEKYVDFSDLKVYGEVNALQLLDGEILFSINYDSTITGLGPVDDSDIIRFIPTTLGEASTGSLSLYFDGSDVQLTTNAEEMDGLAIQPSLNRLLVTTLGSGWVRFGMRDEDLISFEPTSLGSATAGRWRFYFDTSDTGYEADANIYALWFDDSNGDIYMSTRYNRTVNGISVTPGDILRCVPGSTGYDASCTFSLYFDDAANSLAGHNIDGMSLKLGTGWFTPSAAQTLTGADNYGLPHDAVGDEEFGVDSPFELFDIEDAIEEDATDIGVQRKQKR